MSAVYWSFKSITTAQSPHKNLVSQGSPINYLKAKQTILKQKLPAVEIYIYWPKLDHHFHFTSKLHITISHPKTILACLSVIEVYYRHRVFRPVTGWQWKEGQPNNLNKSPVLIHSNNLCWYDKLPFQNCRFPAGHKTKVEGWKVGLSLKSQNLNLYCLLSLPSIKMWETLNIS